MAQLCGKCSRANPPEAIYCYYDGLVLGGHSRNGGPVAVGSQPFNSPFVFPTGRNCRSFDELALACQEEWPTARDLLRQGFLESFLGGLGRVDLALAAREAAKYPDPDRGLDQLLAKLPSEVLAAPTLKADPLEVSLGVLSNDSDRSFALNLENQGMRLLHGTISCPGVAWLTLGDTPGVVERHFEFQHEASFPVRVCGDRLRAGNKPQAAQIQIESNGGTVTITVRCEVPVRPYPAGNILAGAKSPRQVAALAKAHPKEAGAIFERGDVGDWYKSNGWIYPVQGPAASGLGAVQQFFEALGLVPAPKVEISARYVALNGNVGEPVSYNLEVKTSEKKYVYAHGTSDQAWLQVGKARMKGQVATIPLNVPVIPNNPGQTLTANLSIQANGNQRFIVPVSLQVGGDDFNFGGAPAYVPSMQPAQVAPVEVMPAAVQPVAVVTPVMVAPEPARPAPVTPVQPRPIPVTEAQVLVMPVQAEPGPATDPFAVPAFGPSASGLRRRRAGGGGGIPLWAHLLPSFLLGVAVVGVIAWDVWGKPENTGNTKTQDPGGPGTDPENRTGPQVLYVSFLESNQRFGIKIKNPNPNDTKNKYKLLTSHESGLGNNTIVKINGTEYWFGNKTSLMKWIRKEKPTPNGRGSISEVEFINERVRVTQHVEVVPGKSGKLDTCLIYYTIENENPTQPNDVGIRVMIDTKIGTNDGVPFMVPGEDEFLTTCRDFNPSAKVPSYLEAIEFPDNVKDPGTVARLGFKGIVLKDVKLDPVDRVLVTRYESSEKKWDLETRDMAGDSCVAVYWEAKGLEPHRRDPRNPTKRDPNQPPEEYSRSMAFTYGVGELDINALDLGGNKTQAIGLSGPDSVAPNTEFVITAYVYDADKDQKVTLDFPKGGLTFVPGESAEKTLDRGGKRVPISWKVRATTSGSYPVQATSGGGKTKPFDIIVKSTSIAG